MQKSIIKKLAREKLTELKELLKKTDPDDPHTHAEMIELRRKLEETLRVISVYEYILTESEISPDLNVHFKIMEESRKKEEERKEPEKEMKKEEPVIIPVHEAKTPPKPVEEKKNQEPVKLNESGHKKVEVPINDKFRMINELFHHNQQEYNIVIQQLNDANTWEDAKLYIDGLIGVYNWDEDKDIVKTLKRIAQKRFL